MIYFTHHLTAIFVLTVFFLNSIAGQNCEASFYKTSNPELLALVKNCTHISGDLYIEGSEIYRSDFLSSLEYIDGNLVIGGLDKDSIFQGLSSLKEVGGNLQIKGKQGSRIKGFGSLSHVGGSLSIDDIILDTSLLLENLSKIGGGMSIISATIEEHDFLPSLDSVSGQIKFESCSLREVLFSDKVACESVLFRNNELLSDLVLFDLSSVHRIDFLTNKGSEFSISGFNSLSEIDAVFFTDNDLMRIDVCNDLLQSEGIFFSQNKIGEIKGFQTLRLVLEELSFDRNLLSTISGFNAVDSIENLRFTANTTGHTFQFMPSVTYVHYGRISRNIGLINLEFLNSVNVLGDLYVQDNHDLQSLSGLHFLTKCGLLQISGNHNLQSLTIAERAKLVISKLDFIENAQLNFSSSFDSLEKADGLRIFQDGAKVVPEFSSLRHVNTIDIQRNQYVENIAGFSNLQSVNRFIIQDNDRLLSVRILDQVSNLEYLSIARNQKLISFSGFNEARSVGTVAVRNNDQLEALNSFKDVDSIFSLSIGSNLLLEHIEGFDKLRFLNTLFLADNPSLSSCCMFEYVSHLTDLSMVWRDNAKGCNSPEELECSLSEDPKLTFELEPKQRSEQRSLGGEEVIEFENLGSYKILDHPSTTPWSKPKVYPNPTTDYLYVNSDKTSLNVFLHDIHGKMISSILCGGSCTIDLSQLSLGSQVIFVRLVGSDFDVVERIFLKEEVD